jgi:hypothetical protein
MISGLNSLDQVEAKSKEDCQASLTKSIGAHFNTCKRSDDLLKVWVTDLVGEDDEFTPII